MTNNVYLTERYGDLCINDEVLIFFYPEGDVDTVPWPFKSSVDRSRAEKILYDAYQVGELKEGDVVYLPDGELFGKCYGVHFEAN